MTSSGNEVDGTRVTGLGWIAGGRFAAERRGLAGSFQDLAQLREELLEREVLLAPFRRFAKLDDACRMACLVAALTLHDADVACGGDRTHDIAVLGANERGCLETNRAFYADYLQHERRNGRGSLFVYTLPSIPASEVSMHFKLVGPTAWLGSADARGLVLLERAQATLRRGDSAAVLCLDVSESGGVGLLLGAASDGPGAFAELAAVRSAVPSLATLEPLVDVVRRAFRA